MDLNGWQQYDIAVVEQAGETACYVMDENGTEVRMLQLDDSRAAPRWQYQDGRPPSVEPAYMKRIARQPAPSTMLVNILKQERKFLLEILAVPGDGHRPLMEYRRTLLDLASKLVDSSNKLKARIERSLATIEQYKDSDPEMSEGYPEAIEMDRADLAKVENHLARIQNKFKQARNGPGEMLLPIGTHVRFPVDFAEPVWGLEGGGYGFRPKAGNEAVVVGISTDREWPILVAMTGTLTDEQGEYEANIGSPLLLSMDKGSLEVVAPGTFVDGSECFNHEQVPTHLHDGRPEMVVLSAGKAWRIHRHTHGNASEYAAQGWDSIDELSFLVPIEEQPAAPALR